jgi:hypothetical protein
MRRIGPIVFWILLAPCLLTGGCDDDPLVDQQDVGTVIVLCTPDNPKMPWLLNPPGSGDMIYGHGDSTMTDMDTGQYTMTWTGTEGWKPPSPGSASMTLERGSVIRFIAVYTAQDAEGKSGE